MLSSVEKLKKQNETIRDVIGYYEEHPIDFIEDCIGYTPTEQQKEILTRLKEDKFVSVASGRGIGKSLAAAFCIWWFLCCKFKPQVPITAPSGPQLNDVLWSRLSQCYEKLNPIFKVNFEMTRDRIYHKKHKHLWFCVARTAKAESPEALQGFHADNMLFVGDEAAGIPSEILHSIIGSLTQPENYCLLISNPNRLSGVFYDIFHTKVSRWTTLQYSSLDSPIADKNHFEDMKRTYGETSPIYQVHCLGQFPDTEEATFIDVGLVEDAVERNIRVGEGKIIWGLDVARFGDDSSVLAKRHGNVIKEIVKITKKDTMEVAALVAAEYNQTSELSRPDKINVDSIGVGGGVADRLRQLGLPAVDVNVGKRSFEPDKYLRLRDELWGKIRDWLKGKVSLPNNIELKQQLTSIRFKYDPAGKIVIEKKDDYKKRNPRIGSPDLADAVCLCMYERKPIVYDVIF